MKLKLLFPLLILFCINTDAQDSYFYQFQDAPVLLSPTLSGTTSSPRFNLDYQVKSNYYKSRNTVIASFDTPFVLENGDIIGIGNRFLFEKLSRNNSFYQLGFNVNYQKRVFNKNSTNKHYVIFGIEAAVDQKRTTKNSKLFGDFSTGVAWMSKFKNEFSLHFGIALTHINQPNISFNPRVRITLNKRPIFHAILNIPIMNRIMVSPNIYYSTEDSRKFIISNIDFNFTFNKKRKSCILLGFGMEADCPTAYNYSNKFDYTSTFIKLGFQNKKFGIYIFNQISIKQFEYNNDNSSRAGINLNYQFYKL